MYYIISSKQGFNTVMTMGAVDPDIVEFFCKPDEKFTTAETRALLALNQQCAVRLTECGGREEQLVLLGSILAKGEQCTIIDASFPIPSAFAEQVIIKKSTPAVTKRTKTTKKIEEKSESATKKARKRDTDATAVLNTSEPEIQGAPMNAPAEELPAPVIPENSPAVMADVSEEETETPAKKVQRPAKLKKVGEDGEPIFEEEMHKELYQMIHVKSDDIGYSWDTDMLMAQILRMASDAESSDDLRRAISTIRPATNKKLMDACEPVLDDIMAMARI